MPFFCEKDAQVIIANASTQLPINTLREVLSLILTDPCCLGIRSQRDRIPRMQHCRLLMQPLSSVQ